MSGNAWLLLGSYLALLLALAWPLGGFIARLIDGNSRGFLLRRIERFEQWLCQICWVPTQAMGWQTYARAVVGFNCVGVLGLYGLQRLQGHLPLNPQGFPAVRPDTAFNTAVSFVTNTNWQSYAGEQTMSYLTQMLGLGVQNFLSAATGIAVALALIRGLAQNGTPTIGNYWVDLIRLNCRLLLPLALVLAVLLLSQGVIQNLAPNPWIVTLEGTPQELVMGPVASQEAIKMVGTNGGGFFNANSAHPFENPTPLSNFFQMLAILLIPAALCHTLGQHVGDRRQGLAILATMTLGFILAAGVTIWAEQQGNPRLAAAGVDVGPGNLEGKEIRFGVVDSALFATITTAASCGAVTAMHDSFMPLGGLVPLWLIQLGEVIFGGVGSGLYGMLVFALLAVFIAGLMIGRTPEYLGKKIEPFAMKMLAIAILVTPLLVLVGTAAALLSPAGRAGLQDPGAHGLSEVLYAFSSAANNNGSAFAGLSANSPFYNVTLGIAMWGGRFGVIVPVLAIAGTLAAQKRLAPHAGSLPTHGPLFVCLLLGVVGIVGALTYLPALALGPVVEHLLLFRP